MDYTKKIQELKLILPQVAKPVGSYRPVIFSGHLAFLSGQIARGPEGIITGKVGKDLTVEQAREAAKCAALNVIAIIEQLVTFQKFSKFVKIAGFVQAAPDFYEISKVMDAASDLFLNIFGENGIHARTSVGMASLPLNSAVEIEATLEIRPLATDHRPQTTDHRQQT